METSGMLMNYDTMAAFDQILPALSVATTMSLELALPPIYVGVKRDILREDCV